MLCLLKPEKMELCGINLNLMEQKRNALENI